MKNTVPTLCLALSPTLALALALGGSAAASAQNLLANPNFDSTLAGWSQEQVGWSPVDAGASAESGSAFFDVPDASGGFVFQCVPFAGGAGEVVAKVLLQAESNGTQVANQSPRMFLSLYDNASCSGAPLRMLVKRLGDVTSSFDTLGQWVDLGVVARASDDVTSLLFFVVSSGGCSDGGGAATDCRTWADDALLSHTPFLFTDGFEAGNTASWSGTSP